MSVRDRRLLSCAALLGVACYYQPPVAVPKGTLPEGPAVAESGFGAWALVRSADSSWTSGELIAAGEDSLHVLTARGLLSRGMHDVVVVHVLTHENHPGEISTFALFGALSTISHGFGVVLTGPLWVLFGSIIARDASRAGVVITRDWTQLQMWSRFPPGLPSGVDRGTLRLKPSIAAP
jgi:hypothetical protein